MWYIVISIVVLGLVAAGLGRELTWLPDGVWYAPGRVNIIGEHTDYNGGLALPIALPHRAHLALRRREDRVVRLVSPQTREKVDVMDLDTIGPKGTPGEVAHWASYIAGVAWSLERDGFENLPGFDAALVSCVPLGGGLSSSAALECSAAVAIDEVAHLGLAGTAQEPDDAGRARLVTNCVRTENEMAGAPTGGMDQSASMRCREGHALELDCRDGSVTHVPFDLAAEGLFDTERKRPLPFLPRKVGLVCGRQAKAKDDVLVNARLRWPGLPFEVREVAVQGARAVGEVTRAIQELDTDAQIDVIVVARGGGAVEDLLPFSDEGLVRAAAARRPPSLHPAAARPQHAPAQPPDHNSRA